jgi:hypothetical protein
MAGRFSIFRVALIFGLSFVSFARVPTISEGIARQLVKEALVTLGASGPAVEIVHWPYDWAPEFYTFQAWRPGVESSNGVGVLQTYYFAVNPWTGDVWDAMACRRITSPTIEKEQEAIWKRSQLSVDVREAIRKKSPADCSAIQREMHEKKK